MSASRPAFLRPSARTPPPVPARVAVLRPQTPSGAQPGGAEHGGRGGRHRQTEPRSALGDRQGGPGRAGRQSSCRPSRRCCSSRRAAERGRRPPPGRPRGRRRRLRGRRRLHRRAAHGEDGTTRTATCPHDTVTLRSDAVAVCKSAGHGGSRRGGSRARGPRRSRTRVGALPEQEAESRCSPEVRMTRSGSGWPLGVEMLGDVLDVEHLRQLLDGRAARGVLLQQRADGVRDLAPAAVADRDVDVQALDVPGRLLVLLAGDAPSPPAAGRGHPRGHPPAPRGGEPAHDVLDDPSRSASSVCGRVRLSVESSQRVTRSTPASSHHPRKSRIRSAPTRCPSRSGPRGPGPPAVAVEDDPHVTGHRGPRQRGGKSALVAAIHELPDAHRSVPPATAPERDPARQRYRRGARRAADPAPTDLGGPRLRELPWNRDQRGGPDERQAPSARLAAPRTFPLALVGGRRPHACSPRRAAHGPVAVFGVRAVLLFGVARLYHRGRGGRGPWPCSSGSTTPTST